MDLWFLLHIQILKKKVNKNPDLLQIRHEFINFNFLACKNFIDYKRLLTNLSLFYSKTQQENKKATNIWGTKMYCYQLRQIIHATTDLEEKSVN